MIKQMKTAFLILLFFSALTGIIYPAVITALAQLVFPNQANGSLIMQGSQIIGSELIGQQFDQPEYFWGRLSATSSYEYNASASGGSNYSVLNPELKEQAEKRLAALQAFDPENSEPVPVDLITASASGLDPEISIAAAEYQIERVAHARRIDVEQVKKLVQQYTNNRKLGILGERTVNVLLLNLALDEVQ